MKLRSLFFSLLLLLSCFMFSASPSLAQPKDWNSFTTSGGGKCVYDGDVATLQGLECLFFNVLQVIVLAAGLVFIITFISGGFSYLFSAGDQKKVAAASSKLTLAFIGLIGIIISWLVLRFIKDFTGVDILNFRIPGK